MIYTLAYESLAERLTKALNQLGQLSTALDDVAYLELSTGSVQLDEERLEAVLMNMFEEELAKGLLNDLRVMARDGFAVLGTPETGLNNLPPLIPWATIDYCMQTGMRVPSAALNALGISSASTLWSSNRFLRQRFSNIPDWMLEAPVLNRLITDALSVRTVFAIPEGSLPHDPRDKEAPEVERINTKSGASTQDTVELPKSRALDAGTCIANADWRMHWWGWEMCLDYDCAEAVGKALVGWWAEGVRDSVLAGVAYGLAVAAGMSSPPVAAVIGIVMLALEVAAFTLALSIFYANGTSNGKGVCIQGNWPTPYAGPIAWVKSQ
jgi:hypothetical protein